MRLGEPHGSTRNYIKSGTGTFLCMSVTLEKFRTGKIVLLGSLDIVYRNGFWYFL